MLVILGVQALKISQTLETSKSSRALITAQIRFRGLWPFRAVSRLFESLRIPNYRGPWSGTMGKFLVCLSVFGVLEGMLVIWIFQAWETPEDPETLACPTDLAIP